jgi:SAM-dependent methyltransferase
VTGFERLYLGLEPFFPALWQRVRSELLAYAKSKGRRIQILDVGGRKSHYSIGVPASIHILDLPRSSNLQKQLHLGTNGSIVNQLRARRSNVAWVMYNDMTQCALRDESFDCVVAVEVLEHVERDGDFVREVSRVLRPGGIFLMSTPNGDYKKVVDIPDHKRHYSRQQLAGLLEDCFGQVRVEYAIPGGRFRSWGNASWTPRRPVRTAKAMLGNWINSLEASREAVKEQAWGTHHLIACAQKS